MIDDLTNDEIDGILAHMTEADERAKKARASASKKKRRR